MNLFQAREREIFETLRQLKGCDFALIGGYAVNAYTLPRFSVDCDIVLKDGAQAENIGKILTSLGYVKEKNNVAVPYKGDFARYEKELEKGIKVSVDILLGAVVDRQSGVSFSAEWVFKNSHTRPLRGKTIAEQVSVKIIDVEALIILKFVPARVTDIRDIFMLLPLAKNREAIKRALASLVDFPSQFEKIREKIVSDAFRNNLQGVYGLVDGRQFERHKNAFLEFGQESS